MSIAVQIDHERKLVLGRCYGQLKDEEVFNYQMCVWSRPDVAGFNELVDVTEVNDIGQFSVNRVRDLAMTAADMDHHATSTRFAIVAPEDLAFGIGRMFETYREMEKGSTKDVGVFRTVAEAFEFLAIVDPPPLPELPGEAGG